MGPRSSEHIFAWSIALPIEWVFFDMGGVLVDDEPAMLLLYRRLHERCNGLGNSKTIEEVLSLREGLIAKGDGRHWVTAGKILLGDGWKPLFGELLNEIRNRYVELNRPFPGIGRTLESVSTQFSVGLAANQITECRRILEKNGWLDHFKVLGISEEIGFSKPRPEFFQWAVEASGCPAERCIMVGDRIDNDIRPAKALGMKTLWFRMEPDYESLGAADDFAGAYAGSRKRAGLKLIGPKDDSERPDYIAHTAEEVLRGIEAIANG
jgi:FMN phosphatase YigB (HAD superfamily)